MKIVNYRNTTESNVLTKRHNIWLGISLGNKYFTQEHLEDYIRSSLDLVKEKMLIIIADEIQAINYEVFEEIKLETARIKAERNGKKVLDALTSIVSELSEEQQQKVSIIKWADISTTPEYQERLKLFSREFELNIDFRNKLIEIVRLNMGDRLEQLSSEQIRKLATYVLQELPIFMGPIHYEGTSYDLHIYPGLSLMDDFILDLQESQAFPELMRQISLETKLAIAEVYAE